MKCHRIGTPRETESISGCLGLAVGLVEEMRVIANGFWVDFWGNENVVEVLW